MSEIVRYPLFVDPHVHFREPGSNDSETIASGSQAALLGGYGYVYDMPNNPGWPTHNVNRVAEKQNIAANDSYTLFGTYAGWQPDSNFEPIELELMASHVSGFKNYLTKTTNNPTEYDVSDFKLAIEIFHEYAHDKPIMLHAANNDQVEQYIVDIAGGLGHHVHVCHVNDPRTAEIVAGFRDDGYPVSSGVTPHHLVKTSHDVHTHGKFAEMMPPLADQVNTEKLLWQLNEGIIDIVETDHAPHSYEDKMEAEDNGFDCFGVPGIEFAFPVLNYQALRGRLSQERLTEAMATRPAEIMNTPMQPKSYSEWDMQTFRIDDESELVVSDARWTPFLGQMATGRLVKVVLMGQEIYNERLGHIQPLSKYNINPIIDRTI